MGGSESDKFWDAMTGTAGNSKDLFVSYKGYKESKRVYKDSCNAYETLLKNFIDALNETRKDAIVSGEIAEALDTFISFVSSSVGSVKTLGEQHTKLVNSFLNRIDNDDDFLYNKKNEKDFTECAEELFQEVTIHRKETGNWWKDHWNDAGRWFIEDVLGKRFLDDYDANMYLTKKQIKELAKTESRRLTDIFNMVRNDDKSYYDRFHMLLEAEETIRNFVAGMIEVVANKNTFTSENINLKLSSLYDNMVNKIASVVTITAYDAKVIQEFVESNWSAMYFGTFLKAITTFLSDLGTAEEIQMVIYNAFGITKDSVEYGDYEKVVIKQELMDTLEDMTNAYVYSSSDEQEAINTFKKYIDYIKKYGDKWYEHLDKRTSAAKELKEFLDGCGGASKILKYGDKAIDYFYRLFVDYDKSKKIIDSFMSNNNNSGKVKECMDEINELYNKELNAWVKEGVDRLKDIGYEAATKSLEKSVPVLNVIGKIRDTIDLVGEITGSGSRAKSMLNATIYADIYYESEQAYENALKKVRNANPKDKNYNQLISDLQNCFDFCKKNLVNLMKEMANATQGSKKAYYQYCMSVAQNASMADKEKLSVLSYEDYMKYGV